MPSRHKIRVALLGFGNVARAFVRYVAATNEQNAFQIEISAIADSSGGLFLNDQSMLARALDHKSSGHILAEFSPNQVISNTHEFVRTLPANDVSLLVECMPTNIESGEPALDLIVAALARGTNVVTVNKGPVVHGFAALKDAARESGAQFLFSGTTGVSVPQGIEDDRVLEIRGVLNGTTNYILTEMQQHSRSFREALEEAETQGIAEPDPTLDLEGWDTASKILILAQALMGASCRLSEVSRIGIGPETESLIRVAQKTNRIVRLIGRARIWQGRVRVSVAPKIVSGDSPFYSIEGSSKAAVFRTKNHGEIITTARSGRDAISRTIFDDIEKIVRD